MIESIKDLERLFKLCRKQGILELTLPEVSCKFGDLPVQRSAATDSIEEDENTFEGFPDGPLTPEELTFFANGGKPEENPYRRNVEN